MVTLSEAYRIWVRKYPPWKMERSVVNDLKEPLAYILMHPQHGRVVFYFVRCEIETTVNPVEQEVGLPERIVDRLLNKGVKMVVAFRGKFYEVDAKNVYDRYSSRNVVRGENMYIITLKRAEGIDISETTARVKQEEMRL